MLGRVARHVPSEVGAISRAWPESGVRLWDTARRFRDVRASGPFFERRHSGRAMTEPRVAGIVLAAGRSRRMGENKLLVRLGGETVLRRAVRTARAAGL